MGTEHFNFAAWNQEFGEGKGFQDLGLPSARNRVRMPMKRCMKLKECREEILSVILLVWVRMEDP